MTEEIIIDGVNVAGCEYYSKQQLMYIATQPTQKMKDCCLLSNSVNFCKNRVCYYKQLKRLEQENKDLKKQIESDKGLITVGGKQQYEYLQKIDELEQENKELKEKIKKYSAINEQDTKDYARLFNESIELRANNIEYKHVLEEIREIAEDAKEGRFATKSEDYTNGMHIIGCYVLDKINKVLNLS